MGRGGRRRGRGWRRMADLGLRMWCWRSRRRHMRRGRRRRRRGVRRWRRGGGVAEEAAAWGGGAAGGAGRAGGAACGGGGGGGAGLAGGGAAFGGAGFGFGLPSGPSSSLACATTIGEVCACDALLANCITVKAEVASSTRRRFVMMIGVPGKVLWKGACGKLNWTTERFGDAINGQPLGRIVAGNLREFAFYFIPAMSYRWACSLRVQTGAANQASYGRGRAIGSRISAWFGPCGPRTGNSSGILPGNSSGGGDSPGSRTGGGTSGRGLPGGASCGGSVGLPGVAGGISEGSIGIYSATMRSLSGRSLLLVILYSIAIGSGAITARMR